MFLNLALSVRRDQMWVFALAGAIYLVGVGIVLMIKPTLMFTPDGDWKEFGIGQREDRYTPFPFWLFCLVWALIAYFLVMLVEPYVTAENWRSAEVRPLPVPRAGNNNRGRNKNYELPVEELDADMDDVEGLPKGYYVLNRKATRLSGVPKYVYLGPEEPPQ